MKIKSVRIEHFRCLQDEKVEFGDYTCLVGPNGAGKSTVLNALNVFFREAKAGATNLVTLSKEDFFDKDTTKPIRITVTFGDLSAEAKDDLKDYVRHDALVVTAVANWNEATQSATVSQHGQRMAMKDFALFFEAEGDSKPVSELKKIYTEIQKVHGDLPTPGTKQAMIDALHAYESGHPEKCELIESNDEFYGVSKGAHKLGKFVQWIFIPAVKDATSEQIEAKDTALGRLVERTVRATVKFADRIKALQQSANEEYDRILAENQPALTALSASLKSRLQEWASPTAQLEVRWDKDPKKVVQIEPPFAKIYAGDEKFLGELGRLGHGLQRSYMFALLNELAGNDLPDAPRLLLGIEEPELFQHPPQAQHLADVLVNLSAKNAQVFACTHSPYFISGKGFEDVRLVRKAKPGEAFVTELSFAKMSEHLAAKLGADAAYKRSEGVRAKINQALQPALREMFFAPKIVLVEGLEDVAYITSALVLTGKYEAWRKGGGHVVQVEGKSKLVHPLAIAQLLKIPVLVMFDADGDITKPEWKNTAKSDNERLLKLLGQDTSNPFPAAAVFADTHIIWPKNFGEQVKADYSEADWSTWKNDTEAELGQCGGLEKNSMCIAGILEKAWAAGQPSKTLQDVCELLVKFSNS
jgi:energy-coupling factor transporter ATP-binding protein EcfA2